MNLQKVARIEEILLENFTLLEQALLQYGQWFIPDEIVKALSVIPNKKEKKLLDKVIGDSLVSVSGQALFSKSPLAREKFCLVKIKEIKHFLAKGFSLKATAPITLSFLEHSPPNNQAVVTIATVTFGADNLATTLDLRPNIHSGTAYSSTLQALKLSSWLINFDNETVIRFADRPIEQSMSIKLYCEEIIYALASASIAESSIEKDRNFWESFALTYKRKDTPPDLDAVKLVKQNVVEIYSEIKGVQLEPELSAIAKLKEDIDQTKYVERILQNQRAGMGSLLYLPTGFGKTFIALIAMIQHYNSLPSPIRKPYLVVTPKNVQDAWIGNLELLKSHCEEQKKLFSEEDLNYWCVEKASELTEYIKNLTTSSKKETLNQYQIILVTEDILTLVVKEIFDPKYKKNTTESSRIKRYHELLKHSGVILGKGLVIGNDYKVWTEQIKKVLSFLCTPDAVLDILQTEFNGLCEPKTKPTSSKNYLVDYFLELKNAASFSQSLIKKPETLAVLQQQCKLAPSSDPIETANKLFLYLHGYYRHQNVIKCLKPQFDPNLTVNELFDLCLGKKANGAKTNALLQQIEHISKSQLDSQAIFEDFMNSFGGIIADESQLLFVKKPKNIINCRDIIFEMSNFYQTQSQVNTVSNRLIIAASATPWPNELEELRLHLNFLAPKIMKDYSSIDTFLFKKWQLLELAVETLTVQSTKDVSKAQELVELAEHIRTYLYPWIKTIFNALVIYEKPTAEQSNAIDEKFLYLTCTQDHKVSIFGTAKKLGKTKTTESASSSAQEANIFTVIRRFYSKLLNDHNKLVIISEEDSSDDISIEPDVSAGNLTTAISQCLAIIEQNPYKKFAFYVEEQKDALKLKNTLVEFYEMRLRIPYLEVGLFYEENFVKKQKQTGKTKTFNTSRLVNKNAFNNMFHYRDYIYFLNERYNDPQLLHLYPIINYSQNFKPLYLFFKAANEKDVEKRTHLVEESYSGLQFSIPDNKIKSSKAKSNKANPILLRLLTTLHDAYSKQGKDIEKSIQYTLNFLKGQVEHQQYMDFFQFMRLLISFEKHSLTEIIYFNDQDQIDWLSEFAKYLPAEIQQTSDVISHKFDQFREMIDQAVQTLHKVDDNILLSIQYSLLYYIHYLYLSRVFIFGQAGTSGMRVDADMMFMFCGAWTEGRLTQIKGRFGRYRGRNEGRRCTIYAPLTNSAFEFFILKYYILKALNDQFVTADNPPAPIDICAPIFLAELLYQHYISDEIFVNNEIQQRVEQLEKSSPGQYFAYTPLQKAEYIIPPALTLALQNFKKIISEASANSAQAALIPAETPALIVPALNSSVLATLQIAVPTQPHLHPFIESWPTKYSDWIQLHAVKQGWKQVDLIGEESDAGEFILALLDPVPEFKVTNEWKPTTNLINCEVFLDKEKFQETELSSDIKRETSPGSSYIPVGLEPENGTITIDNSVFAKAYRRDSCYAIIQESDGTLTRNNYKTTVSDFKMDVTLSIENIYIELTTKPHLRHQIMQITAQDLTLGGYDYSLFGFVQGGHHLGKSHFITYRLGSNGYYICNDLHKIEFVPNDNMPINPRAVIFRFVRKDKLESMCQLVPKNLVNYNNNCFINAAFQLADTIELRDKIAALQNQAADESIDVEDQPPAIANTVIPKPSIINSGPLASPTPENNNVSIEQKPPTILPHALSSWTESDTKKLSEFCDPAKHLYIMIVPSRGVKPDLPLVQFATYIQESCDDNSQILLLFGTNHTNSDDLDIVLKENSQSCQHFHSSKKIFIKEIPFVWNIQDKQQHGKVPIGQMRNFCLKMAYQLWLTLLSLPCNIDKKNINLLTADGDVELRPESLAHCQAVLQGPENPYSLVVFGYEILFENNIVSENASYIQQNNPLFFAALTNHISMNINSRSQYLYSGSKRIYNYTGYPSEPLLLLKPALTRLLFEHLQQQIAKKSSSPSQLDNYNIFGYTDIEGRRLTQYLQKLCHERETTLAIIPPSKEPKKRPILREFARFTEKSIPPSFIYLKQQLERSQLAIIITQLTKQPQSSMNFHFTIQNKAEFFNKNKEFLMRYGSYFYAKNLLLLLNLGPRRMLEFSQLLRHQFVKEEKPIDKVETEKLFNVSLIQLQQFIDDTFKLLFDKDKTWGVPLFEQFTQWLLNVAYQLICWFHPEYKEERDSRHVFQPMALPADYPQQAFLLMKQESQGSTELTNVLKEYLEKTFDFSTYSVLNKKLTTLQTTYDELRHLGRAEESYYAITIYANEEIFQKSNEELARMITKEYAIKKELFLLNLVLMRERYSLIYSQVIHDKYYFFYSVSEKHSCYQRLSYEQISEHCPTLNLAPLFPDKRKQPDDELLILSSNEANTSSNLNANKRIKLDFSPTFSLSVGLKSHGMFSDSKQNKRKSTSIAATTTHKNKKPKSEGESLEPKKSIARYFKSLTPVHGPST